MKKRSLTQNDQQIARSIAFISRHLNEPIKMTQLAEMANLSPSYFWALFKQKTGYAPIDFLIRLRMDQACHLLTRTKMMVKQIAASLGYKDSLYFSRAFKSIHDVAPTLYRVAGSNAMPLLPPINLVSFSPLSGKRQSATKLTQDNTSIGCEDTRKRALPVSE